MIKIPHWTIICIAIGAFLLPIVGGYPSLDGQRILATDNLFVSAIAGEKAPFLTHFLVSLLFFIPMCATLFAKKISHVVNLRISIWLAILGACVGASIVSTSFPSVTVGVILEWAMMSLAFFAVTLCCGRKQSAIPILSFLAGSTFAAILGIFEFGQARLFDPHYRISALQVGPNQAGALFAAGTVLCLAMSFRYERIGKLALVLSAIMQCFAMVLTQSKGAFVCLPIGLLVLLVALLVLKSVKPTAVMAGIMIPILITGGLAVVLQKGVAKQSGQQAMSRVFNSNSEANQSAGFRKLLWSSAIELTQKRPMGWGMGSFWYESTRPGKVTQTALAHQTFLQLACEASPIAPIALFGFLAAVVIWGLRGIKTQTADGQILLVGILGTLVVAIAHNFVDSDMYVFGLGSLV
ncbi:MAG: O-antigen ligase family protein, partial [Armatimonadota bacterium]